MLPLFLLFFAPAAEPEPAIAAIQREIAQADGIGGYYDTTYSKEEFLYWKLIPGWIRADAATRKAARVLDIGCGYGTLLVFAAETYHASGSCLDVIDYL